MKLKFSLISFIKPWTPLERYHAHFIVYVNENEKTENKIFNYIKLDLDDHDDYKYHLDFDGNFKLTECHIAYTKITNIKTDKSFLVPAVVIDYKYGSKFCYSKFICTELFPILENNNIIDIFENIEQFSKLTTSILKDYCLHFELASCSILPYNYHSHFELTYIEDIEEYFNI